MADEPAVEVIDDDANGVSMGDPPAAPIQEAAAPIEPPVSEVADADASAIPHNGEDAEDVGGSNQVQTAAEEIQEDADVGLRGADAEVETGKTQQEDGDEADQVLEENLAGEEDKEEAVQKPEVKAKIVKRETVAGEDDAEEGDAEEVTP